MWPHKTQRTVSGKTPSHSASAGWGGNVLAPTLGWVGEVLFAHGRHKSQDSIRYSKVGPKWALKR